MSSNDGDDIDERGISRRRVLQSVGASGMAFAGTSLFATSVAAGGSPSPSVASTDAITGDELGRVVRAVASDENVSNVMGRAWVAQVQRADVVAETRPVSTAAGSRYSVTVHRIDTSGQDVVVKAARHALENGNELTVAALAIGEDRLLVYRSFDRLQNGRKSGAELYDVQKDAESEYPMISAVERSINGSKPKQVSEVDDSGVSTSAECDDPCGGCYGAPPGSNDHGYFTDASCRESIDLGCVGQNCSTCGFICLGGPAVCAACLVVMCTFWSLVNCCPEDPETQCLKCLSGSDGNCNNF